MQDNELDTCCETHKACGQHPDKQGVSLPIDPESPGTTPAVARSRVSNGTALFLGGVDGRTVEARRFRDLYAEITGDLTGAGSLSEAQRQLARRAAALSTRAEQLEAELAQGAPFDLESYIGLTNVLVRTFNCLGMKRLPKRVEELTPEQWSRGGNLRPDG